MQASADVVVSGGETKKAGPGKQFSGQTQTAESTPELSSVPDGENQPTEKGMLIS